MSSRRVSFYFICKAVVVNWNFRLLEPNVSSLTRPAILVADTTLLNPNHLFRWFHVYTKPLTYDSFTFSYLMSLTGLLEMTPESIHDGNAYEHKKGRGSKAMH